jgi:hypothetical protein
MTGKEKKDFLRNFHQFLGNNGITRYRIIENSNTKVGQKTYISGFYHSDGTEISADDIIGELKKRN